MFGKWHLGYCDDSFRPHNRGFDTAFGLMGAGINYLTHKASGSQIYDYWNGENMVAMSDRTYTTDDFVDRLVRMATIMRGRNQNFEKIHFQS